MNSGRDRDELVERLLHKSLARGDSSAAGACPEPDTLAAWVDGGLDKRALALVEAHASECARCQAVLATIVQTAPDPSPPGWQETWLRGWGFRWLVPMAATAAAAVVLWVVVPNNDRPDLPEQARTELPKTAPTAPPPEARTERFNAQASSQEQPGAANGKATAKIEDKTASIGAVERELRKEDAAAKDEAAPGRIDSLNPQAGAVAPAAPPAQPQSALNETVTLSRAEQSVARGRRNVTAAPIEITSPDPSVRWRIGGNGAVEHTTNGGTTWEAMPTGTSADLIAGASPSRSVCWLVGGAGTVLLSTDGRMWRRVPFPEMTDLATVQATDAQTATVTTANGRMFRTTDGGRRWAPLQGF